MFVQLGENTYSEIFDPNDMKNKLTLYLYNLVKTSVVKETIQSVSKTCHLDSPGLK